MKILFIASASNEEGTGHAMRALRISQLLLKRGHSVAIAGPIEVDWVLEYANSLDVNLNPDQQTVFDLIVLDTYRVDYLYTNLRKFRSALVIQVCDSNTPVLRVDGCVWLDSRNPTNFIQESQGVLIAAGPDFMTGPSFIQNPVLEPIAKNVLVVLGGSPTAEIHSNIVELLSDSLFQSLNFHFVSPNRASVKQSNFSWYPLSSQMEHLVGVCDTIVTNAGTSLWELLPSGRVMGSICLIENQHSNYDYVVSRKLSAGLGVFRSKGGLEFSAFQCLFFDESFRRELYNNILNDLKPDGRSTLVDQLERFVLLELKDTGDYGATD